MWLIVLVIVIVAGYSIFKVFKFKGSDSPIIEAPLDILKKRCSQKQFGKEEIIKKKQDLDP